MSGPDFSLGIVSALPEELGPLLRRTRARLELRGRRRFFVGSCGPTSLVLGVTGDGPTRARMGLELLLEHFPIERLLVVGISGALTPTLVPGQILSIREVRSADGTIRVSTDPVPLMAPGRPEAVFGTAVTTDSIVRGPEAKRALARELELEGPAAVDLESVSYVRVAQERSLRCGVIRCICDSADDDLPRYMDGCQRSDGSIDRGRIVRYALRHPSVIRSLFYWRRRVRICAERLASFVEERFGA